MKSFMNRLRAILKVLFLALISIPIVIFQPFILLIPSIPTWFLPRWWHRSACWACGIHITQTGNNAAINNPDVSIVYASNHSSYLDIPVHGTWLQGMFIAKSDIANWPVFGFLAKMQATIFVERRPSAARKQKEYLQHVIQDGSNLLIFPEGTTSNGRTVLPFKSSLFGAVTGFEDDKNISTLIQPISVFYTHIDGKPITTQKQQDKVAWYGDMELIPHLWPSLQRKKIHATIHFHDPLDPQKITDRKQIAYECEKIIQKKAQEALA